MTLRRIASVLPALLALPVALMLAGCSSLQSLTITPAAGVVVLIEGLAVVGDADAIDAMVLTEEELSPVQYDFQPHPTVL